MWKQRRDTGQNPAEYSQARKQDDTQDADSWNHTQPEFGNKCEVWIHDMSTSETEFRNMRIPNHQDLEKGLPRFVEKLGTTENLSKFGIDTMKTNVLMWGLFTSSSMKTGVILDRCIPRILVVYKNTNFEEIQNLFDITQNLISDSEKILNARPIESKTASWTRSMLSKNQMIKWTKGKRIC